MLDISKIPETKKEKKQYPIIQAGECEFEIKEINVEDVDFYGKPAIRIKLLLKKNGEQSICFMTIPAHDKQKIKELCESINKIEIYESLILKNEYFIGCKGLAINYINEYQGIKRNKIKKFIKNVQGTLLTEKSITEDDIPF